MQETRQHILEILRARGQATVDEIVEDLQKRRGIITPVTVRHHLSLLQQDDLITEPETIHRTTPGRPKHVYALTAKAKEFFPNNYQHLLSNLLQQISQNLPKNGINVILEDVADRMAVDAHIPNLPPNERLNLVVDYLNQHGYNAAWEETLEGFVLHTTNCPYHHIAESNIALCEMDMRLVTTLMGTVPRLLSRVSAGGDSCSYLIPFKAN